MTQAYAFAELSVDWLIYGFSGRHPQSVRWLGGGPWPPSPPGSYAYASLVLGTAAVMSLIQNIAAIQCYCVYLCVFFLIYMYSCYHGHKIARSQNLGMTVSGQCCQDIENGKKATVYVSECLIRTTSATNYCAF